MIKLLVLALFIATAVSDAPPVSCDSLWNVKNSSCGYQWIGQATEQAGDQFLRTPFRAPTYTTNGRVHTFLCVLSQVDTPECYGLPTQAGDRANVRIPNVVNYQLPCHVRIDGTGQRSTQWAWDAIEIPPVSTLESYVDVVFHKDGTPKANTQRYWGAGINGLKITKLTFTDAQWVDEQKITDLYGSQWFFTNRTKYDLSWNDHQELIDPCDPASNYQTTTLYDFFEDCAHTWVEHPSDSLWNTQTADSYCVCSAPSVDNADPLGTDPLPGANTYFWWYGTCDKCDALNHDDAGEWNNTYIPSDNFDNDLDTVPNNCDLCPDFDDRLDADFDRVPNSCDECPGFPDYVDINSNKIPDACDFCSLVGCGKFASDCQDGVNEFTCTCQPEYQVDGPVFDPVASAASFLLGTESYLSWAAHTSSVVSSNLEDVLTSTVVSNSFSQPPRVLNVDFVLVHDLPDFSIISLFDDFLALIDSQLSSCAQCGLFSVSYTWEHTGLDKNGNELTSLSLQVTPYLTEDTFNPENLPAQDEVCKPLDLCLLYGCGDNARCAPAMPGYRSCICNLGFVGDAYLKGDQKHPNCTAPTNIRDECADHGCQPDGSVTGATPGLCSTTPGSSQRTCTCDPGFRGTATLDGEASFSGCILIDNCNPSPCGPNSTCTSDIGSFVCACAPGFVNIDPTRPGQTCTDPCSLNNGGCQDVCVSPSDENEQLKSCSCSNPNASPSSFNDRNCVCNAGYFGDGLQCTTTQTCLVDTVWGNEITGGDRHFFKEPKYQGGTPYSPVCLGYSDLSCCVLGRPVYDRASALDYIGGDMHCSQHLEKLFCSTCDPEQKHFSFQGSTFVVSICADLCQAIFSSCSGAFDSNQDQDPPVYLTQSWSDPIRWCEEGLIELFPFKAVDGQDIFIDAHGTDRSRCFSGASGLASGFYFLVSVCVVGVLALLGVY